jgi:hypothetical protein
MANSPSAVFRGQALLRYIQARCEMSLGDCWIWRQGTKASGVPVVLYKTVAGWRKTQVNRLAWETHYKKRLGKRGVTPICETGKRCCNPRHQEVVHRAMLQMNHTKMTPALVLQIRGWAHAGARVADIAAQKDLSKQQVYKIVNKVQWKHV